MVNMSERNEEIKFSTSWFARPDSTAALGNDHKKRGKEG